MRVGNLHIITDAELQRLYKVFRPADLDEKRQLEGQIDDLHQQLEGLQRDYEAAIEAGDRAVDRSARANRIRRAVLLERKDLLDKIEVLEQQVKDLTDAVQQPPKTEEEKQDTPASVQTILDKAQKQIGFSDDLTSTAVQSYIEREIRLRGEGSAEQILADVLAGGATDDEEETE